MATRYCRLLFSYSYAVSYILRNGLLTLRTGGQVSKNQGIIWSLEMSFPSPSTPGAIIPPITANRVTASSLNPATPQIPQIGFASRLVLLGFSVQASGS